MSKEELNIFSEEDLHVCEEERWHTVSFQKFVSEIPLGAAIEQFLRSLPLKKRPFSVISEPAFTNSKLRIKAFATGLRKTSNIAGVLKLCNLKRQESNFQLANEETVRQR